MNAIPVTDRQSYEANVRTVIKLYKDLIMTNEPAASKLADKLFGAYGFCLREERRFQRDAAKVSANKATK